MGFLIPDHLGPVQMTTDTALGVTKRVIVDRCGSVRGDSIRCSSSLSYTHDWVRRLLTLTSDVDFFWPDLALLLNDVLVISIGLPNDPVQRARKR